MVLELVGCPTYQTSDVVKHGTGDEGKQRYRYHNTECSRTSFIRDYTYRGYWPEVKRPISDMAMNGSGIRDTARVLKVSSTAVIEALKKHRHLEAVNRAVLEQPPNPPTTALMVRVDDAEMDEMCSFVPSKQQQRWLWHAIDHQTGLCWPRF